MKGKALVLLIFFGGLIAAMGCAQTAAPTPTPTPITIDWLAEREKREAEESLAQAILYDKLGQIVASESQSRPSAEVQRAKVMLAYRSGSPYAPRGWEVTRLDEGQYMVEAYEYGPTMPYVAGKEREALQEYFRQTRERKLLAGWKVFTKERVVLPVFP